MEDTQLFRLIGTTYTKTIPCKRVDGQSVVLWDDIEQVFSNVQHVENRGVAVNLLRDSNRQSGRVSISKAIQEIRSKQVTQQGRAKPLTQDDSAKQLSQIWDLFFACHHELKDEMDNNTDLMVRLVIMQNEAKALQAQAHSQLTPLEKRIRAILNRPCELNESLVPRLFVVFPQDCSTWDYENPSHNKLRLYFLCDCGDHSRSIDNKIPHDVHFAKHDGYDLVRPTEFFQLYGIYVLTIMQMLRSRIPVAGITIPTLPHLIGMDTIDQDAESVNELVTGVEQCMDQVIDYITMVSGRAANVDPKKGRVDIIDESIAVDLAQLKTFLKPKKEKTIGNLHRTVTPDGQVRWVCGSHYHDIHQENDGQVLQSALAVVKGSFDETVGRVQVAVSSSKELELLCSALRKSQGVYGLKIEFLWDASYDDLKKLRDALFRKNIGALEFCFRDNSEIQLDISSLSVRCDSTQNRGLRYEPILEIMQQPSVYSFALSLAPWDIFHRSSLLCRNDYFFNLRFLEIGLKSMAAGIQDLKGLVAKSPNLVNLTMNVKTTELVDVYDAIAEHQTCPVLFKEQALRILPPARHQSLSNVKSRDLTDFLRVHGGQIESLSLNKDWNAKLDVMVFAETIQKESKLKEFGLKEVDLRLGERCIKYLGNIIALSELRKLEISLGDEDERAL
ncbi:hypothetical protein BGX31_000339 [Mortierella sp. GBA43]|nr:hypothetical protein BGX31_000339 [Mortierella sp. GBA43]